MKTSKAKSKGEGFLVQVNRFRSMDDFALVLYRLASEAQKIARDVRNSDGVMLAASVLEGELKERADRTGEGRSA